MPSVRSPDASSRIASSHSRCAIRIRASRRPTLTTHSRKIEESTSVSSHIALGDCRARDGQIEQRIDRDMRHFAPIERLDIVVGDGEQAILQVEEFARDMDRNDLPAALAGELLAIGEAFDQ